MTTCSIYQIYFSDQQLPLLDKAFIPYNNAYSPCPEQREYAIFKKNYEAGLHKQSQLTGMISWKFAEKAKITGEKFIQFIQENPGYDVYYINPFPEEHVFNSVWEQADCCHPGIMDLTQHILDQVNYKINLRSLNDFSLTAAYCNFWVGSEKFWDMYMSFTKPIYDYIMNDAPEELKKKLFMRADRVTDSVYFPFIMERLFSTLLHVNQNIKALKYEYSHQELKQIYNDEWVNYLTALNFLDKGNYSEARKYFTYNIFEKSTGRGIKKYFSKKYVKHAIRSVIANFKRV